MARYLDSVEHPWTRSSIERALFASFTDAKASVEETAGGKLWREFTDLGDSVWIFEASTTELLDEISLFGDRSKDAGFWKEANFNAANEHTRAVKRKIFNCTSSLMALVDHARNFQRKTPVPGYADRIRETFAPPGLHEFLQCLRNYNTHWRVAEANWNITHNFKSNSREVRFQVRRSELLAWDGWTSGARQYLEAASAEIDVYAIFSAYREHVQSFYAWHKGVVLVEYAGILQQYFEYKRLLEGLQRKYNWNLVISHAPKTLNPFQYVDRYLSKEQVERLLAYEPASEAQVDALIRMVGMEEFCDDSLRAKVLALFKASKSTTVGKAGYEV